MHGYHIPIKYLDWLMSKAIVHIEDVIWLKKMVFYVTMATSWMKLLMNNWANIVMDDKWVHPLAQILSFLVKTSSLAIA